MYIYLRLRKDGVNFGYPAVSFRGTRTLQEAIQKSYPTDFFPPPRKPGKIIDSTQKFQPGRRIFVSSLEGDLSDVGLFLPSFSKQNMLALNGILPPKRGEDLKGYLVFYLAIITLVPQPSEISLPQMLRFWAFWSCFWSDPCLGELQHLPPSPFAQLGTWACHSFLQVHHPGETLEGEPRKHPG